MTLDAVLLAAGTGSRFTSLSDPEAEPPPGRFPKQFQLLGNVPVFIHSLRALLSLGCFRQIVIAVPDNYIATAEEQLELFIDDQPKTLIRVITGGATRQESSRLALEAIEGLTPLPTRVLIHDACRAFVPTSLLERAHKCLLDRSYGAWVPVTPVVDTIKRVDSNRVIATVERAEVRRVQTPQVFEYTVIRSLIEKVKASSDLDFTDDASLCEYFGIPVGVFEGDVRNIKLTYDFELEALRAILDKESQPCALGSDTTSTA